MQSTYFQNLWAGIQSSLEGLSLSIRHFWAARRLRKPMNVSNDQYFRQKSGVVTLQYPYEAIPVPDNGRYRLHNEMDDCIVCDKCAKICPVNCIEIEPIKATEQIGTAADGSPIRLYAAKFDIDMAKCCYCGLCTTVCPTECLTMTKAYDYSEYDISQMIYHFANLSPEEAQEKLNLLEIFQREKAEAKKNVTSAETSEKQSAQTQPSKPTFKPKVKPAVNNEVSNVQDIESNIADKSPQTDTQTPDNEEVKPKAKFIPKTKPIVKTQANAEGEADAKTQETTQTLDNEEVKPKAKFIPKTKPIVKTQANAEGEADSKTQETTQTLDNEEIKPKAKFIPKTKPIVKTQANAEGEADSKTQETTQTPDNEEVKPKAKFIPKTKPIIKPKKEEDKD
ncbi:MAG: 4Fe-4S binding protein [Microscillaceae bacterium]|nr:4Fe-4S binding protein [Microscillaceae bacterium]